MKHTLVAVTWRDPRVDQANAYTREEILARHVPSFTTFGLLVREDAEVVAVAGELGEDGTYRAVTYILRPLILSITPLATWPKRTRTPKTRTEHGPTQDSGTGADPS